jgi:hypothetical protein
MYDSKNIWTGREEENVGGVVAATYGDLPSLPETVQREVNGVFSFYHASAFLIVASVRKQECESSC